MASRNSGTTAAHELYGALAQAAKTIEAAVRSAVRDSDFTADEVNEIVAEHVVLKRIRAALSKARGEA